MYSIAVSTIDQVKHGYLIEEQIKQTFEDIKAKEITTVLVYRQNQQNQARYRIFIC